jgi:hypothetical protein
MHIYSYLILAFVLLSIDCFLLLQSGSDNYIISTWFNVILHTGLYICLGNQELIFLFLHNFKLAKSGLFMNCKHKHCTPKLTSSSVSKYPLIVSVYKIFYRLVAQMEFRTSDYSNRRYYNYFDVSKPLLSSKPSFLVFHSSMPLITEAKGSQTSASGFVILLCF